MDGIFRINSKSQSSNSLVAIGNLIVIVMHKASQFFHPG